MSLAETVDILVTNEVIGVDKAPLPVSSVSLVETVDMLVTDEVIGVGEAPLPLSTVTETVGVLITEEMVTTSTMVPTAEEIVMHAIRTTIPPVVLLELDTAGVMLLPPKVVFSSAEEESLQVLSIYGKNYVHHAE